jgi:hypothetical protein
MSSDTSNASTPAPRKRKIRKWLLIGSGGIAVGGVLLVALAPSLAGLGVVRSIVSDQLTTSLTPGGKVQLTGLNLAWLGGQRVDSFRLLDAANDLVASVRVTTELSLIDALRQNLAIGQTVIDVDAPGLRVDIANGTTNIHQILGLVEQPRPTPGSSTPPSQPSPLPEIRGTITINLAGSVSAMPRGTPLPTTVIEPGSRLVFDLSDPEAGVKLDAAIKMTVDGKPASVSLAGTADVINNRQIEADPNQLRAALQASIQQLDLAVVQALLPALGVDGVSLAGVASGSINLQLDPGMIASLRSDNLRIDQIDFTSQALSGDRVSLPSVVLPINASIDSQRIRITGTGLTSDIVRIDLSGDLDRGAVERLAAGKRPGVEGGSLTLSLSSPSIPRLTQMLPNTLALKEGVVVESGVFSADTRVELKPDGLTVKGQHRLAARGTANGKRIEIEPTTVDIDLVTTFPEQGLDTNRIAEQLLDPAVLRDLMLKIDSSFLDLSAKGNTRDLALSGRLDATQAFAQAREFVDVGEIDLAGVIDFNGRVTGNASDPAAPIGISFSASGHDISFRSAGTSLLDRDRLDIVAQSSLATVEDRTQVTIQTLNVATGSGIVSLNKRGEAPATVVVLPNGMIGGSIALDFAFDASRLAGLAGLNADPSTAITSGRGSGSVTLDTNERKREYDANMNLTLTGLSVGSQVRNETINASLRAFFPQTLDWLSARALVDSGFGRVTLRDARVRLESRRGKPATPLRMVENLDLQLTSNNLPAVQTLLMSLGMLDSSMPTIQAGAVNLNASLLQAEDGSSLAFAVTSPPNETRLALRRGNQVVGTAKPVELDLAGTIALGPPNNDPIKEISEVRVDRLKFDLWREISAELKSPLVVSGLGGDLKADARIELTGVLATVSDLLVIAAEGEPLPMGGSFLADLTVTSGSKGIELKGLTQVNKIRPADPNLPAWPVRSLQIDKDLVFDAKASNLTIRTLTLSSPETDAISVSLTGAINDLVEKRNLRDVVLNLSYDLAALQPMVLAVLDPQTRASVADLKMAGRHQAVFRATGSYPASADGRTLESWESIRSLAVTGELLADAVSAAGVDVRQIAVPVSLQRGVLSFPTRADGSLRSAVVNDGELNLGGVALDLSQGPEPILVKLDKHPLVRNASLNPVLSNSLGKYFNPVFPNATNARGLLDVTVSAGNLRLGESLTTANSGDATVLLSLRDMEISNPLGETLLGGVVNQSLRAVPLLNLGGINTAEFQNFAGELRDARFTLSRGVLNQDATFLIGNVGAIDAQGKPILYPLSFRGDVRLTDQAMNLDVGLPLVILKNRMKSGDFGRFMAYLPDSFQVGLTGTTAAPRADFKNMTRVLAEAGTRFAAGQLLGGNRDSAQQGASDKKDTVQQGLDILGGLLGAPKKDQDKPKEEPKKP